MQGLDVRLRPALDRHEAHRRPCRGFRDRFGIMVVILVGLHIKANIFRRPTGLHVENQAGSPSYSAASRSDGLNSFDRTPRL